jgi:uncharacterized membrane protein YdbT with pleckstrin-like domain
MADLVVRPSTKILKPYYTLAIALAILVFFFANNNGVENRDKWYWGLIVPGLILAWTIARNIQLRFTSITVAGGKLRYESGILAKSTEIMEIAKVQNVRVDQTLLQRMLGIGDLSIETAGEGSRRTMLAVDRPQQVADLILAAAHKQS